MPIYRITNDLRSPRRSRRLLVFIGLSVLIHGLFFYVLLRERNEDASPPQQVASRGPLEVRMLEPARPQAPAPAPAPKPAPQAAKRKTNPRPPAVAQRAPVRPRTPVEPSAPAEQQAPPATPTTPAAPPVTDMMDMINAARERRRAAEQSAAEENSRAVEQERGPSANDVAMANIKRDLQRNSRKWDGTGGLFRIVSKGPRMATFQFRGWMPSSNARWQETIEVDAGPNGDVELAIVRRMIALIRTHHTGDFNWESHRLGRILVLSARPEDNAQLEAFLMKEFFGA